MDRFKKAPAGTNHSTLTGTREHAFVMRLSSLFLSITLALASHQHLHAQVVTKEAPPSFQNGQPGSSSEQNAAQALPDLSEIPHAVPLPPEETPDHVIMDSDTQSQHGDLYLLAGDVVIKGRNHELRADTVTYNKETGEATLQGHVHVTGGENNESIQATHGNYNIKTETGTFYDVYGSAGLPHQDTREGFVTTNPFLFEGKVVLKTGPDSYEVFDGSVTSCLLPHPDWQLFGHHFVVSEKIARAHNSTFKLLGIPAFFLPYVTHPVDSEQRLSGILIPDIGYSSSKGFVIGEQFYLVLGRSADLTVGSIYYSRRGYSENGTFRYRGQGQDFFNTHFSALQDRGYFTTYDIPATTTTPASTENIYTNQGGQDVTAAFRHKLTDNMRVVGDAEYLSSYVYREAFTNNFNQAVSTDILSTLYVTRQNDGYSLDARVDRYQGEKVVPTATTEGQEVRIFHAPSLDFTALDHPIFGTPLLWNMSASAAALKRSQPNFQTDGMTERFDLRPEISLPLHFDGWNALASVALRETFYSRSREVPYDPVHNTNPPNATPIELTASVNRTDVDYSVDIRPPVLERDFTVPQNLRWLLGDEVRHTIEPELTYRNVHGIDNFLAILRFDDIDLAADTDELKYSLTQHLYFRPRPKKTTASDTKPGCAATKPEVSPLAKSQGTTNTLSSVQLAADEVAEDRDVLTPEPQSTNDANGIPDIGSNAPDVPIKTHGHRNPCDPTQERPRQQEWFSWELAQKHFFAQNFGGAVIDTRRNLFDSTLDFSGIAFLTDPRSTSPLISRMRFRTSSHSDFEWDFDYDTGLSKFTSQNVFIDAREGQFFGGISYAYLNAPGRTNSLVINSVTNLVTKSVANAVSNFSQMRVLLGYGTPTHSGLSAAAGAGIDLYLDSAQYTTVQASYNWNCCGLSLEYRQYNLGTIRNEGTYTFNFTLANIGSAGNMRRAQSLF